MPSPCCCSSRASLLAAALPCIRCVLVAPLRTSALGCRAFSPSSTCCGHVHSAAAPRDRRSSSCQRRPCQSDSHQGQNGCRTLIGSAHSSSTSGPRVLTCSASACLCSAACLLLDRRRVRHRCSCRLLLLLHSLDPVDRLLGLLSCPKHIVLVTAALCCAVWWRLLVTHLHQ